MSLLVSKLVKVRQLGNGIVQARCPACAEGGGDRSGEHLRIYPDGRFGCCVHPKNSEHRKRIFALAGDTRPRAFTVKVVGTKPVTATSVKYSLLEFDRTLRTGKTEWETTEEKASYPSQEAESLADLTFRTSRTGISNPRAYGKEEYHMGDAHSHTCKDWEKAVLNVLECSNPPTAVTRQETAGEVLQSADKPEILPYITPAGDLVIPFASPERYHWWKNGQSVEQTRREALERFHAEQRKNDDTEY